MTDHHIHGDLGDEVPDYDPDFPYPHLDDPRVGQIRYIGKDKATVNRITIAGNRRDWPYEDYDSRFDEDLESNDIKD